MRASIIQVGQRIAGTIFAIVFPPAALFLVFGGLFFIVRNGLSLLSQAPSIIYELNMWFTS